MKNLAVLASICLFSNIVYCKPYTTFCSLPCPFTQPCTDPYSSREPQNYNPIADPYIPSSCAPNPCIPNAYNPCVPNPSIPNPYYPCIPTPCIPTPCISNPCIPTPCVPNPCIPNSPNPGLPYPPNPNIPTPGLPNPCNPCNPYIPGYPCNPYNFCNPSYYCDDKKMYDDNNDDKKLYSYSRSAQPDVADYQPEGPKDLTRSKRPPGLLTSLFSIPGAIADTMLSGEISL